MAFQLDEAELRALAQIEAETNCDIGAGLDWGQPLGQDLAPTSNLVDHGKLLEILQERLGTVLSQEELEETAQGIQAQLRTRLSEKLQSA
jgi:hypothetical protein